jgi:hypothetical protein
MLHLRNEILERRIRYVADEQIAGAVLGRQEMIIRIRSFRCHPPIFVVSGAESTSGITSKPAIEDHLKTGQWN